MQTHQLVLGNRVEEIPCLAEFVETICESAGVSHSLMMNLDLALEEAVTNVMLYAYPEGTAGQVEVECMSEDGLLTFQIRDAGAPFDPTQQADADVTLGVQERPIGGLGIFLVRQIMDEVRYERKNDKNVLTLVKRIEEIKKDKYYV